MDNEKIELEKMVFTARPGMGKSSVLNERILKILNEKSREDAEVGHDSDE